MVRSTIALGLTLGVLAGGAGCSNDSAAMSTEPSAFRDQFTPDRAKLASTGVGTYWSLQPGRRWEYSSADGDTLVITVLQQTEQVDGVTTRVVEEREHSGGALKEVSRNYFAADPATGDLYSFGEDVDIYEGGVVVSHAGAWRSGVNGARFGLALPGAPSVGMRYYQEIAPGVAMDRGEVVSVSGRQTVPAGMWDGCVLVRETTPLEHDTGEKWYAPGVGLIHDGEMDLVGVFGP